MADIIHVGLPKSASTLLQKHFFNKVGLYSYHSSITTLPRELSFIYKLNENFDAIKKTRIVRLNDRAPIGKFALGNLRSKIDQLRKKGENLPLLISSEGLVGVSYSPLINNFQIALVLKEVFEKPKIIFIFRKQADYVESLYKQLIYTENRFKRFLSLDNFCSIEIGFDSLVSYQELRWDRILENYFAVFGESSVLALPFEMLKSQPELFFEKINEFIKPGLGSYKDLLFTRENVSAPVVSYSFKKWFRRDESVEFSGICADKKLAVGNLLRKHNEVLTNLCGINLIGYGY